MCRCLVEGILNLMQHMGELYKMKVPAGEAIIDEVVNLLRRTKSAADIALHMEV